jgi:hypothetical protein
VYLPFFKRLLIEMNLLFFNNSKLENNFKVNSFLLLFITKYPLLKKKNIMTNNDYAYPPVGTTSDNRLNIQPNYPNQPQQPYHPQNTQVVGTLYPACNKMTANYTKKDIGNIT